MPDQKQPAGWRHKVRVGSYKPSQSEMLKDGKIKKLEDQIKELKKGEIKTPEKNKIKKLEDQIKELKKGEIKTPEEDEVKTLEDQIKELKKGEIKTPEKNEIKELEDRIKKLTEEDIEALEGQIEKHREHIEPWLGALLQADNLNLLIGNGLTMAIAKHMDIKNPICMSTPELVDEGSNAVQEAAKRYANSNGHAEPNIEHVIHVVHELIHGLRVVSMDPGNRGESIDKTFVDKAKDLKHQWSGKLDTILEEFFREILKTEEGIRCKLMKDTNEAESGQRLLESFLLTFANRTATRERLHVFTTNYDRLIEFGADLLGLRIIDRFVGELEPAFRASRLGIDMYYNPPGIRGEPRHLEGVMRITKLHGSIDWKHVDNARQRTQIVRVALPFGAAQDHSGVPANNALDRLMIYPNAAKDIETVAYPYAELFRDFAMAVCQPNTVLVTYGYGFGDDHINRILQDMLTIPSTHIVIVSFDNVEGRISKFCRRVGHDEQISLLIGAHFGDLQTLVDHYLPKPITDRINQKRVELLNRRELHGQKHRDVNKSENPSEGA